MDQSSVFGTKRKLNNLCFDEPSKPKSTYGYLHLDSLHTSYPMLTNKWKHPVSFNQLDCISEEEKIKKCKFIEDRDVVQTSTSLVSCFSLNFKNSLTSLRCKMPPAESIRTPELLLDQVDGSEVGLEGVEKRRLTIDQDKFEKILQAEIKGLLKQGGCSEDIQIECSKQEGHKQVTEIMKNPNLEGRVDRSDNGTKNDSQNSGNKGLLNINVKNEYRTKDDKDDEDDEDDEDDDEDEDEDDEDEDDADDRDDDEDEDEDDADDGDEDDEDDADNQDDEDDYYKSVEDGVSV